MDKYSVLQNITVLVVEDEKHALEELSNVLSLYCKKCYTASNGEEGLNSFKTHAPDIILTDIGMPKMSGIEMILEIRKINDKLPIIVSSIFNDTDIFLKCIEMHISSYVLKPINIKNLLKSLSVQAEAILKEQEMIAQRDLIQVVMNEIPTPVMVTGMDHDILYLNDAAKNKIDKPYKKDTKCYGLLYGNSSPCEEEGRKCPLDSIKEHGYSDPVQHSYIDKTNQVVYVEIKTKPLKDKDGNIYAFVELLNDVSKYHKENKKLEHLANHDLLTGLPNRVLLYDRIEHAIKRSDREGKNFALLFIDLDYFKDINDNHGHEVGDILLQKVTNRIKSSIRGVDTLARFGGDEFIVIIEDLSSKESCLKITQDIISSLNKAFRIGKKTLKIQCSIGIDMYETKSIKSKDALLNNADKAMYRAKDKGRNTFCFANEWDL